jgi:type II secretory ATPase GspE/PulE/Tfp pilus assembly ATPase PilB-like protein
LLSLCKDGSAVTSSVDLILNQRLVRSVCGTCAGNGCPECLGTGYRGRVALVEFLRVTDALRNRLAGHNLEGISAETPLLTRARAMVESGTTNDSEVHRVLG